jgi:hypothetical protein
MGRSVAFVWLAVLCAIAIAACDEVSELDDPADTDTSTDTTGGTGDDPVPPPMNALDVIFVVDDSISMTQEQAILSTSIFHLIATLTTPRVDWPYPAVDDVRIAVITTNMGFSADGESGDTYWPGDMVAACEGFGDDGKFQEMAAASVSIQDGVIPCWGVPGECPPGWECAADESPEDTFCQDPNPGSNTPCPALDGDHTGTAVEDPNSALALEVACLTSVGTQGCGFEQQLASVARAASREDQAWFFRENAGLGIVIVSDEDDCSMDDNAGLFATEEVADLGAMKINIACGEHPEYLHGPEWFVDAFAAAKGGVQAAVFLAAIVGVPPADACQGTGEAILGCLLQPEMQLVPEQTEGTTWFYHPACTREVGAEQVTIASPGRRFVQLAESMGDNAFVYSICNDDWMPAMESFAAIMAGAVEEY